MSGKSIVIEPYQAQHQEAVIALILGIQNQEFGIDITADQQPDLRNVQHFYQQGNGGFWIARSGDVIVGCIGLKDIGDRQAALRKMFVAAEYRGRQFGTGAALLNTLLEHARARRLQDVYLGTTAKFLAAHRFYEKNGFDEIAVSALPESFPVMKVDSKFYRLSF